jgi:hypothetical protein
MGRMRFASPCRSISLAELNARYLGWLGSVWERIECTAISSGQFGGILCWKEYISSMEKYELALIDSDDDIAAYHHIRRLVLFGGSDGYIPNGPEEVKKEIYRSF